MERLYLNRNDEDIIGGPENRRRMYTKFGTENSPLGELEQEARIQGQNRALRKLAQRRVESYNDDRNNAFHDRMEDILQQQIYMGAGNDLYFDDVDEIGAGRNRMRRRRKGGVRAGVRAAGMKHNPWIMFLHKHKGKGYSRKELVKMYKQHHGGVRVGGVRAAGIRRKRKGGVRAAGTKKMKNPWIMFLHKHRGKGYSRKELVRMYKNM